MLMFRTYVCLKFDNHNIKADFIRGTSIIETKLLVVYFWLQ